MLSPQGRLTHEHWGKTLFHPEEDMFISKIFEMITDAALQAKATQMKMAGKAPVLDERMRQDPANSTVTFARTFGWAAQVLGVAPPSLYIRNDVQGGMMAVTTVPPASVAGAGVLSGFQPQELAFICAKHLSGYRKEHYIKYLFPTQSELTIMFFAGVLLAAPNTPLPAEVAQQARAAAEQLALYMNNDPMTIERLRQVVKMFIDQGARTNIKKWMQTVELTAVRAGFLVCGDLNIARKILAQEPTLPGDRTAEEKLQDLLVFATSERYFNLRRALGVQIQTG